VKNRHLTDGIVGNSFGSMTRDELLKRLADADIAFAEVNSMDDLAQHPHLRRIEVTTPNGVVSYPAPAAIVVGEPRHYGAVPAIGERPALELRFRSSKAIAAPLMRTSESKEL
jgi:itaconate CoA-transferase